MLTPSDIRNPARQSGFDHVKRSEDPAHPVPKPFQAILYGGKMDRAGTAWRGPRRALSVDSAQDYCDYINNGRRNLHRARKLKSAGHKGPQRPKLSADPEVAAALGVLRDARAQRRGVQGYVYLIIEVLPGGGLHYGKIGYSTNPPKRVAELQTGNPRPLRLHLSKPGTEADEAALHQKYLGNNVLQEWFYVTKELLLEWDASHQVPVAQSDGQSRKEATTA